MTISRKFTFWALPLGAVLTFTWNAQSQAPAFDQTVKPFLQQNCVRCHNENMAMSGIRVDQLDGAFEDRHLKLWEAVQKRISEESMPPKGQPQPAATDRLRAVEVIGKLLDTARSRPTPKNGLVRRLTVSQYRNTLRELLQLEDDMTEALPPDAISADGFVNNKETLQLSPVLLEAYFEIADQALSRSIVDPSVKPMIQKFRMDLGTSINRNPLPEQLILGANSHLLENKDFTVTQPAPVKPFPFEPFHMQTKYRYIEGYQGNDTVRGWREYDSIYHNVFACVRGSSGYPKGAAYGTVPQGLLLRPAIPNEEQFDADGTYGPKANFKISLRDLPDNGRFRVTVNAAKYNDGLLLDSSAAPQQTAASITARGRQTVNIPAAGIYQVDVHAAPRRETPLTPDGSRLNEKLAGQWTLNEKTAEMKLEGKPGFVDSPFGRAISLDGEHDSVAIPRGESVNVGTGDFTVSAWIQPKTLRRAGIVTAATGGSRHGWTLEMADNRGTLRLESSAPLDYPNGIVSSSPAALRTGAWQHVAAVVRRSGKQTRLYVNGYPVGKGDIAAANLDNPEIDLHIGSFAKGQRFQGEIDEVRLYRRALSEAELQALVQPGVQFAQAPPAERPQDSTLTLGDRQFTGKVQQPAFLAVRLPAGPLAVSTEPGGVTDYDRVVLTPLAPGHALEKPFLAFEKRAPRIGVYVGLRRDCGSTLAPVGEPKNVKATDFSSFIFEGAIRNFPSPDVEKDNVNYLAGVREIGVRSEYTDGRDMPRLLIRSVEFEGPFYESWPPPPHKNIFIESPHKNDPPAYAREIIRRFATRAYRRPITAAEETALMAVYTKSSAAGGKFSSAIKDALQVVLTSPQFLFLIENSRTPAAEPLENHELSSKLSYFLWNGPPDQKTQQMAAAGTLRKNLDAEVTRMVADPRFARFINEFTPQWLSLEKFAVLEPDKKRYPKLTRDARTHLRQEPVEFVRHLLRNNLPVSNLIQSDFVMADETVASYYGLAEKPDTGFQFVAIPHKRRELGGVLTQPAILAGLSDGRESNPVKRGAWLARRIVSEPPDPPPPNVPALKEDLNLTLRQRIEQHRNQPGCQQCHAKIDPWGIPFEEYDAGGLLKAQKVDASSKLPDKTEVDGIDALRRYLANDRIDQVAFSFVKNLTVYATGRSLTYNELNFLKQDSKKLRAGGYRMQDMIRYVVNSKMFLEK